MKARPRTSCADASMAILARSRRQGGARASARPATTRTPRAISRRGKNLEKTPQRARRWQIFSRENRCVMTCDDVVGPTKKTTRVWVFSNRRARASCSRDPSLSRRTPSGEDWTFGTGAECDASEGETRGCDAGVERRRAPSGRSAGRARVERASRGEGARGGRGRRAARGGVVARRAGRNI